MNSTNIIEQYQNELLSAIPVVSAMDVSIVKVDKREIQLTAPLNTNINYEGTAFGGSLNTICVLSCYLMTHHLVKSYGYKIDSLVIQDSQIKYLNPVDKDFKASAVPEDRSCDLFLKLLDKKGQGRLNLNAKITDDFGKTLVEFNARFVAKIRAKNTIDKVGE